MKILVTGSAGFLGRALIPKLQLLDHYVIGIDLQKDCLSNESYQLDLRSDITQVKSKFDMCIHLASTVGGFLFNANNKYLEDNEILIINKLSELCRKSCCKKIIFTSSTNVFESSSDYPIGQLKIFNQKTPYAKAKVSVEKLIPNLFEQFTILRPTNLFGKDQKRTHDKIGESHVIPDLIHKIKTATTSSLEILGDGTQIRNFLHVDDAASCICLLLQNEILGWYNVRSEIHISIAELANILISVYGKNLKLSFNSEYSKYEPVTLQRFDVTPLLSIGWKANVNSIQQGLIEKYDQNDKFIFPSFYQNSLI